MRSEEEIQFAHDILEGVLQGDVARLGASEVELKAIEVVCRPLCWVLGHAKGKEFGELVEEMVRTARAAGYKIVDYGEVQGGES